MYQQKVSHPLKELTEWIFQRSFIGPIIVAV
jgi:hypothetical protein